MDGDSALMKHLSLVHTLRSSIITRANFRLIVPNTTLENVCIHVDQNNEEKVIWSLNNITLAQEETRRKRNEQKTNSFLSFSLSLWYTDGHSHITSRLVTDTHTHTHSRKWWCFNQYLSHCWLTWSPFLFTVNNGDEERRGSEAKNDGMTSAAVDAIDSQADRDQTR